MNRPPLRGRVTYAFGAWWYDLRTGPEFADYTHPIRFATAALAADAARRELYIRAEPDRLTRGLLRLGVIDPPTRSDVALAN